MKSFTILWGWVGGWGEFQKKCRRDGGRPSSFNLVPRLLSPSPPGVAVSGDKALGMKLFPQSVPRLNLRQTNFLSLCFF